MNGHFSFHPNTLLNQHLHAGLQRTIIQALGSVEWVLANEVKRAIVACRVMDHSLVRFLEGRDSTQVMYQHCKTLIHECCDLLNLVRQETGLRDVTLSQRQEDEISHVLRRPKGQSTD